MSVPSPTPSPSSILPYSHVKSYISLFVEFIPQVIFLMAIFGWLVFLMCVKWVTHYANSSTVSV